MEESYHILKVNPTLQSLQFCKMYTIICKLFHSFYKNMSHEKDGSSNALFLYLLLLLGGGGGGEYDK